MLKIHKRGNSYLDNKPQKLYNTNDLEKAQKKLDEANKRLRINL